MTLVREFSGKIPILGVCLGHQVIAAALGGSVIRSRRPRHGMASSIEHDGRALFEGLPNPLRAARYHSLVVAPEDLPEELEACAWVCSGNKKLLMAIRHQKHLTFGLQFHPESVLTEQGHRVLENFLKLIGLSFNSQLSREPAALGSEAH